MLSFLNHPFPDGPMIGVIEYLGFYEFLFQLDIRLVCNGFNRIYCKTMDIIEEFNINFYKEMMRELIVYNGIDRFHNIVVKYRQLTRGNIFLDFRPMLIYVLFYLSMVNIMPSRKPCGEKCPMCKFCHTRDDRERWNTIFIKTVDCVEGKGEKLCINEFSDECKMIERCFCKKKYNLDRCNIGCPHSSRGKIRINKYIKMCISAKFFNIRNVNETMRTSVSYKYFHMLLIKKYQIQHYNFMIRLYFGSAKNIDEYIFLTESYALRRKYIGDSMDLLNYILHKNNYQISVSDQPPYEYIDSLKPVFGIESKKNILFELTRDWVLLKKIGFISIPIHDSDYYRYPELHKLFGEKEMKSMCDVIDFSNVLIWPVIFSKKFHIKY
jgi:hypothetical protein